MDFIEACNSQDRKTRIEAVREAIENNLDSDMFEKIINNCNHEDVLVEIAVNNNKTYIARGALDKLNALEGNRNLEDVLIEIAVNSNDYYLLKKALDMLDALDGNRNLEDVLIEIAVNNNNSFIVESLLDKLNTPEGLMKVALNARELRTKINALGRISGENYEWAQRELIRIAKSDERDYYKILALGEVTDDNFGWAQDKLVDFAKNEEIIGQDALNRISADNLDGLVDVANNAKSFLVASNAGYKVMLYGGSTDLIKERDDIEYLHEIDDTDYSNYSREEELDLDYDEWLESKQCIENFCELEDGLKSDIFQAEKELWVELEFVNDEEISFIWLRSEEEEERVGSEIFARAAYETLYESLNEILSHKGDRDIV